MKKTLSLCFLLVLFIKSYAQGQEAKLFPVVDSNVVYQKIIDVEGKDKTAIHLLAFNWIIDNFDDREKITDELANSQSVYKVKVPVDIYTVQFYIQIDSKDNKYKYSFYNIKHTVTGKDENSFFAKYLVNVTAATDNSIVKGEGKYSKGQRKNAQKTIILIDEMINKYINSLNEAVSRKAASF
ncbi:MAG: hypothetical protein V4456_02880 [Bacteroidota bacterium]